MPLDTSHRSPAIRRPLADQMRTGRPFVIEYAAMGLDECLTQFLVQLGDRSLVAIVKMDGERQRGRWTVLVSGEPLGGELVRWDGDDLDAGLSRVMAELRQRLPGLLD